MSYFNHAFKKVFVATMPDQTETTLVAAGVAGGILTTAGVHISELKNKLAPFALGPGVVGFFDPKTYLSIAAATIAADCCSFLIASSAIKLNDKQGPYHGGYQEANKSKMINPKYLNKLWKVEGNAPSNAVIELGNITDAPVAACDTEFLCGETYNLRIDIKGTPALRFANHNLYRTLDASGGCCVDPSIPVTVDGLVIYQQWANQILEDQFFKDFVTPILVVNGDQYAPNAEIAAALGIALTYADLPTTSSQVGLLLVGAYMDTTFGNCSFVTEDYYGVDPIQIYASEVDLNGDPCTFAGICVNEACPGTKGNGSGEQKVRELILAESYLQNFMADDQRIREITQGSEAYVVLNRSGLYSSFFVQHVVPRFNNPSSTFDHDQYLLEIIGTDDTTDELETMFETIIAAGCIACTEIGDYTGTSCTYTFA